MATELRAELLVRSTALRDAGVHPRLAILLVGEDESSLAYVRNLVKTGERAGIAVHVEELPHDSTASAIRGRLERLGEDERVHGVICSSRCRRTCLFAASPTQFRFSKTSTERIRQTRETLRSAAERNSFRRRLQRSCCCWNAARIGPSPAVKP